MNDSSLPNPLKPAPLDPFTSINDDDKRMAAQIAARVISWIRDYRRQNAKDYLLEPEPQYVVMDILVAHYWRDLKLGQWVLVDDLAFIAEYVQIAKFIDRRLLSFPMSARLRFARKGEIFNPVH